jgi:hypothetical protein
MTGRLTVANGCTRPPVAVVDFVWTLTHGALLLAGSRPASRRGDPELACGRRRSQVSGHQHRALRSVGLGLAAGLPAKAELPSSTMVSTGVCRLPPEAKLPMTRVPERAGAQPATVGGHG